MCLECGAQVEMLMVRHSEPQCTSAVNAMQLGQLNEISDHWMPVWLMGHAPVLACMSCKYKEFKLASHNTHGSRLLIF